MTTIMSYWENKGRYQHLADAYRKKLVPPSGKAATPHGELLRNAFNVYHDFHNNASATWHDVVENNRIHPKYRVPRDAPAPVKRFFGALQHDYESVEEQLTRERDKNGFEPEGVTVFTTQEMDDILNHVVRYVDKKEKDIEKDHV